ncbi:natural killer cell receptor 2B4-like isoform X2 [Cuculus canorus]|uniref:natural killer cell receptor 2B4-like isoform X2 n=1 Tax=Cuculus canorus TaxID=55661 RepID=UPI0023AA7B33|nr:natural killer cell receptor 2B4-like isoform X2 [Cuculus canorus]
MPCSMAVARKGASLGCHLEMSQRGGPQCPLALLVLLCPVLLTTAGGRGPLECQEQTVSAGGALQLRPEKPPREWIKVDWRVKLTSGESHRILTAEENKDAASTNGSFNGRAVFHQETLSLQISPVSRADSGVYKAEFEDTSGRVTALCFRVSVWDPVPLPQLEAQILHREQSWCNLSLVCTVPGAGNVSYSWSCSEGTLGDLEPQPRLHLQVHGDAHPTVCCCNVSNLVSWSVARTDIAAACRAAAPGLFKTTLWWAMGLALAISVAFVVTCYWWRKRRKDLQRAPPEPVEQMMTVYEEVGKAQTNQTTNENSEDTARGNTIYTVVCPKTLGRSHPQEPQSTTIYSTIQPMRKVPSLKRKRLDPALVSTAYTEVTGGSRHWRPPSQTLAPSLASHHLS